MMQGESRTAYGIYYCVSWLGYMYHSYPAARHLKTASWYLDDISGDHISRDNLSVGHLSLDHLSVDHLPGDHVSVRRVNKRVVHVHPERQVASNRSLLVTECLGAGVHVCISLGRGNLIRAKGRERRVRRQNSTLSPR